MIKTKIEFTLNLVFKPTYLEVVDESHKHAGHSGAALGGHYKVTIASKAFEGKKMLECHRMIYQALEGLKSSIHALAVKIKVD